MATESAEPIERWTAKRWVALVIRILKGETSVTEAARPHGLTVAEVEDWREKFPLGAEHALRTRPKDDEALKDDQVKKLKQTIGELVLDNDILEEALKPYPFGPENIRRVRATRSGVSERRSCWVLEVARAGLQRPGGTGERRAPRIRSGRISCVSGFSSISRLAIGGSGCCAIPGRDRRESQSCLPSIQAEAVVGPSAVVYASTTRPRLGEPGQSKQ